MTKRISEDGGCPHDNVMLRERWNMSKMEKLEVEDAWCNDCGQDMRKVRDSLNKQIAARRGDKK